MVKTEGPRGNETIVVFKDNDAALFAYRDRYPNGLLFKVLGYCRLYPMHHPQSFNPGQSPPYSDREKREGYKRNIFTHGDAIIYLITHDPQPI
jgi:hypothetical protein